MTLGYEFYQQDALIVAKELLGKLLVRKIGDREVICSIVETEAYIGPEDKGCHAYQNKRTKRTEVMFHSGGHAYIYFIYGMYYCFNVVTNLKDKPEAVLIRAVEPIAGLDIIKESRCIKSKKIADLTNGPGKLCQALNINKALNGYNLVSGDQLYIKENPQQHKFSIKSAKRINIDYAEEYIDMPWRFYIKDNPFVSKY
ncbi:MAG: DNA-3-methyladenine glycosylase [Bacillota bacterium]|nr:DNA-3-methyladenine glycosylase [Bacillota bacterium]